MQYSKIQQNEINKKLDKAWLMVAEYIISNGEEHNNLKKIEPRNKWTKLTPEQLKNNRFVLKKKNLIKSLERFEVNIDKKIKQSSPTTDTYSKSKLYKRIDTAYQVYHADKNLKHNDRFSADVLPGFNAAKQIKEILEKYPTPEPTPKPLRRTSSITKPTPEPLRRTPSITKPPPELLRRIPSIKPVPPLTKQTTGQLIEKVEPLPSIKPSQPVKEIQPLVKIVQKELLDAANPQDPQERTYASTDINKLISAAEKFRSSTGIVARKSSLNEYRGIFNSIKNKINDVTITTENYTGHWKEFLDKGSCKEINKENIEQVITDLEELNSTLMSDINNRIDNSNESKLHQKK